MKKLLFFVFLYLFVFSIYAQKNITPLKIEEYRNSNAVVRDFNTEIRLNNSSSMTVKKFFLITVLNSKGDNSAQCYAYYDDDIHLKEAEALIYDANGQLIKKVKKKDFKDESAVSGGTLYSDARVKYLNYKPVSYPYSIAFLKEYETSNTAFIPKHTFIPDYDLYVKNSSYKIFFDKSQTKLNIKEKNFENYGVKKQTNFNEIFYTLKNVEPIPREDYHLPLSSISPIILATPTTFSLSGYEAANITNWQKLGEWFNNTILVNRRELSPNTINKVKQLTANIEDPFKKAKIIYNYVQNNTRYVSVQVGIGGYQPILADNVDKMKYGDCKGLSNYTKALLEAVGVEAYYTHVEAGNKKINFEDDFASLAQGNHVILAIPYQNDYKWIDCTSQTIPFGFLGNFTDDRKVLIMKPDGGEIVKTPAYLNDDNYQSTKAQIRFSMNGEVKVEGKIITNGIQYDNRRYLENYSPDDLKKRDYKYWSSIDNLHVLKHDFKNDKENIQFEETFKLTGNNFGVVSGKRIFIPINPISAITGVPQRYRNRKTSFYISRGYRDKDEIEISIPQKYSLEAKPESVHIETEFGTYKMSIEVKENKIIYKKDILIKEGVYQKDKYAEYREFRKKIANSEKKKISLIKKS